MIKKFGDINQQRVAVIIDDEVDTCMLLGMFLKRYGIEVHIANNLNEGTRLSKRIQPTLIFLDNNLPDGLGIEHIQALHNISEDTQIVMISAMSNLYQDAIEQGAAMFVDKPLTSAKLKGVLDNLTV